MTVSGVLLGIAILSALWGVVSAVMIAEVLRRHGARISWIFLRVMILKYLGQYRDITRQETGRTGPLFYSYVIAMNLALAAGIVGIVLRAM